MIRLLLLARLLSAPMPRVELVAAAALSRGNDADLSISRVQWESGFDPCAERVNRDGSTDWSLGQMNSRYHDQHRDNLVEHARAMENFQALCNRRAAGDPRLGLAIYHRWVPDARGRWYADQVMAIYAIVAHQVIPAFNAPTRAGGVAIGRAYNTASEHGAGKETPAAPRESPKDETHEAILSKRLTGARFGCPAGRSIFERKAAA